MKYIDADILRVKITDLCTNANFYQQKAIEESNREDYVSSGGEIFAYAKVLSLINSLQQEQPEVFDSAAFQKGVQEGRRLEREDVKSTIQSRIDEILGDAQPNPVLRMELQELIKKIEA